jgi:polyisoprenoid-binding protein YceI
MMQRTFPRLTLLILFMLAYSIASAVEFKQVLPGESTVAFGYTQMGVPLDGKFNQFSAQLSFDPARLDKAQAKIAIEVASIDTGSSEANEEVVGKAWFDAKAQPLASFTSTGIKALGGNRYEATGKLTIKGRTLDVKAPVTFQSAGNKGWFDGAFTIKRLDYAIGEGAWSDVGTVANEIQIKFHLVVTAAPNKK